MWTLPFRRIAKFLIVLLFTAFTASFCLAQDNSNPPPQSTSKDQQSDPTNAALVKELDAMKKRIDELEAQLKKKNATERQPKSPSSAPANASGPSAASAPASPATTNGSEISSQESGPAHPNPQKPAASQPFAFADFTWLNGSSREKDTPLDTKLFTPEFRADVAYIYDFNHP